MHFSSRLFLSMLVLRSSTIQVTKPNTTKATSVALLNISLSAKRKEKETTHHQAIKTQKSTPDKSDTKLDSFHPDRVSISSLGSCSSKKIQVIKSPNCGISPQSSTPPEGASGSVA
jgi:hypothetical protein